MARYYANQICDAMYQEMGWNTAEERTKTCQLKTLL
jgi:hypothetical protein